MRLGHYQHHLPAALALALALLLGLGSLIPSAAQINRRSVRERAEPVNDRPIFRAKPVTPEVVRPAREVVPGIGRPLDQNPLPVRKALVIEDEEKTTPSPPAPAPAPPPPDTSSPGEDLLNYANLVYSYQHYSIAIRQYEKYLLNYPNDPGTEEAWYRLGESYLHENDLEKAEKCYRSQLTAFPLGSYGAAGAYRLASLSYDKSDYKTAETNFRIAEGRTTQREIKLAAGFYRARSLDGLQRTAESAPIYEALALITEDNPYREAALLYLARNAFEADQTEEALKRFTALSKDAASPAIRAEALVKAGLLASDQGDVEKSHEFLTEALETTDDQKWKPFAYFALIQNYYNNGQYEKVISTYTSSPHDLPDESRAKMLLMVGNAYRQLKQYEKAAETYTLVEKYYAEFNEGQEAGYRKLLCLHETKDPDLAAHVDFFVDKQQHLAPQLRYIDMALMLKAETLFAERRYATAGDAYAAVRPQNIPAELRSSRLYKLGWSRSETGNAEEAIDALTDFIILNPSDPLLPSALAQRAANYKSLGNIPGATRDLLKVTSTYPKSEAAEFSWQQLALVHGQEGDMEKMKSSFQSLLTNFPQSKGAAEAYYWIGYAHFDLKQYKECLEPLNKARELDIGNYHERATLRTLLAHYYLQDSANLKKEVTHFLNTKPETNIPPQVLAWLGLELFSDQDFQESEKFLAMASNPDKPESTKPEIWNHLGKARIETGKFADAITAIDFYFNSQKTPSSQAKALLDKSIAQLGLKQFDSSLSTAREALALEKQGRTNALIRMQLGDIAMGRQRYEDAAREYIIISEIFVDPEITPRAMEKAAAALEKFGDKGKAEAIREDLRTQFPDFEVAN